MEDGDPSLLALERRKLPTRTQNDEYDDDDDEDDDDGPPPFVLKLNMDRQMESIR